MQVSIIGIKWIEESDFYKNLDKSDEIPMFPQKYIVKDILTDESIINIFESIRFFGSYPFNYFDYIRTKNDELEELEKFKVNCIPQDIEFIDEVINFIKTKDNNLMYWAVNNGNIDYIKYCYEKGFKWIVNTTSILSLNGHLECLRYAHENNCPWHSHTMSSAALNGHLDCLRYAHENKCPWDEYTYFYDYGGEHIFLGYNKDIHQYTELFAKEYAYSDNYSDYGFKQIYYKKEHLSYEQMFYDHTFKLTTRSAALNGHLNCLKYAHENGCPWDIETTKYAVMGGHLDCLIYAHKNGCPWDPETAQYAASYCNFECLKYALEHQEIYDLRIMRYAARGGDLKCIKYIIENYKLWDTPWVIKNDMGHELCDIGPSSIIASSGNLDLLKYAHESGCPWDSMTIFFAAKNGHLECVKYAHQNGCPFDEKVIYLDHTGTILKLLNKRKIHEIF